jgi:CrcB protein
MLAAGSPRQHRGDARVSAVLSPSESAGPWLDPEEEPDPDPFHHARPTLPHAFSVAAGGVLGVLARDLLLRAVPPSPFAVPWMLVGINIVGAAALGILASRLFDPHPRAVGRRLFLATGFLGGFTTYSSLLSASVVDGHSNHLDVAFVTLLATSLVGVAVAWLAGRSRAARST